LCVAEVRDID
jgi:hypothetical protein